MLVPLLWYLRNKLVLLNIGSFILRSEVWTRMYFQASLLMVHISQVSIPCIAGHHDDTVLNENVMVLFNKHLCR